MNGGGDTISIVLAQEAEGMAKERTLSQIKDSGQFLYKKTKSGNNPRQEFFDLFVYLLSDPKKAGKAVSSVTTKNFTLDGDKQLDFEDILELKNVAYNYIEWYKANDIDEDSPIPLEYRHLAYLNRLGSVKLDFQACADHLLNMFHVISYTGGDGGEGMDADHRKSVDLYVYDDNIGIYTKDTSSLKSEISRIAGVVDYKDSITQAQKEILFYVAYSDPIKEYPFNQGDDKLPVINGVIELDFDKGNHRLLEHSPNNLFTFYLPVKFDPTADPGHIDSILRQYIDEDHLDYLYQIPAQCILQGFCKVGTYRTAYIIQGPAYGGKSTYYDLLMEHFFSDKFVANVALQKLCGGSDFATYNLPGKFLNGHDDLDDMGSLKNIGDFKTLIGGYNHSVEKKHVQSKQSRITCVHLFTCNRPPLLENPRVKTDVAWWERWVYIKFGVTTFTRDPDFKNRNFTHQNLSGFLNRILEYVVKIRVDISNFKTMPYEEVMENWDISSDTLSSFISDCFFPLHAGRTSDYDKEKMLKAYKIYCEVKGVDDTRGISTIEKLARDLIEKEFTSAQVRIKVNGKVERPRVFRGPFAWNRVEGVPDPTFKKDISVGELS